jgi:UDP-N-acetylmuramoyl-L-alanyl-D-glutamate--2,6-diaminopimelate ligase
LTKAGDIILIAGKGHEKYQEIKGVKHPFDDLEILKDVIKTLDI